ncbi:MAG: DUF4011 domain-containing protein [Opitutales bacterium]
MSHDQKQAITKVLEASRRKLLDTGTRNKLVHVNRANARANCINVINERSNEIYSILRVKGKRMRFKALGVDQNADEDIQLSSPEMVLPDDSERLTDAFIETALGPEALIRRLLKVAGNAKIAEEEQGVNILFLAMGFLSWRESESSEVKREAPLILLPVELIRNKKTSSYDISCRDDDLTTNLPLQERMRQDFGIVLPEIEETEGWNPAVYFDEVDHAIEGKSNWSIDRDGMQLGFFSFAKLLMHRDLDPENWPDGNFEQNPLLDGLLMSGFPEQEPFFGEDDNLDKKLDPADIIQVIDADSSQTKVIEEVRRGASMVVQGPPGTGKSQTITNIIAAAAHDGKSVLFVAEKMAALKVVHDRLVKTGLRDICLELHSRSANKKAVAQELGRTLGAAQSAAHALSDTAELKSVRDRLNEISDLLHEPLGESGISPFSALSSLIGFIGSDAPPPMLSADRLASLNSDKRTAAKYHLGIFLNASEGIVNSAQHPFKGTTALSLQPTDIARLELEISTALDAIPQSMERVTKVAEQIGSSAPKNLDDIERLHHTLKLLIEAPQGAGEILELIFSHIGSTRLEESLTAGKQWSDALNTIPFEVTPQAWAKDFSGLKATMMRAKDSWFFRTFGGYKKAFTELSSFLIKSPEKRPEVCIEIIDSILNVQSLRAEFSKDEDWLKEILSTEWRAEKTQFLSILQSIRWLKDLSVVWPSADLEGILRALIPILKIKEP